MQLNKQLIVIILLASLLISAIVAAYYFYDTNEQNLKKKNELVTLYIAKEDIPVGTLLEAKHLAKTNMAKQFVLNRPLVKEEILGKFTNERIYKHEVFLKQKLDTEIKKEQKELIPFDKSAYNMQFALYKNPNYALQQGEYINIISVYPKGDKGPGGMFLDFEVSYVAPNIKILGFIRDGKYTSKSIEKIKVKKIINKELKEIVEEAKADELVLDVDLDVLLKLIKDYNLGTQLWMTRTKYSAKYEKQLIEDEKPQEEFKEEKEEKNIVMSEQKISVPLKPKKYLYKMYTPKNTVIKRTAMINYENGESETKTKDVNIVVAKDKLCSLIKDKFIIGSVDRFNIRSSASLKSEYKWLINKNTVIPYLSKEGEWYKSCDDKFVHESVVEEATPLYVKDKLGKYE